MKKIILASVSSIALLGLAACSDDEVTTTEIEPAAPVVETAPEVTVAPEPAPVTNEIAEDAADDEVEVDVTVVPDDGEIADDDTVTQSIESDDTADETIVVPADETQAVPAETIDIDEVEPADDVPAVQ